MLPCERPATVAEQLQVDEFLVEHLGFTPDDEYSLHAATDFPYGVCVDVDYRRIYDAQDGDRIRSRRVVGDIEGLEIWILHPAASAYMVDEKSATPLEGDVFDSRDLWDDVRRSELPAVESFLGYLVREYGDIREAEAA